MKFNAWVPFLMITGLATGALADDRRPYERATYSAELTQWQFAPEHDVKRPKEASIRVDFRKMEATLTVVRAWYCPPNALCAMVMPAPLIVKLPITAIRETGCGSTVIEAIRDNRRADGLLEKLHITDHSRRLCMDRVAGETVVKFTRVLPFDRSGKGTTSKLSGDKLRRLYQ